MSAAFVHEFPGPLFAFRRSVEIVRHADVLPLIDGAFAVLRPVMRPIAVEVSYAALDAELGLPTADISLAARVVVLFDPPGPGAVFDTYDDSIVHGEGRPLASCLVAPSQASPDYVVAAANGRTLAAAANLPSASGAVLSLMTRTGSVELPIARDAGAAWIVGPVKQTPTQPPIRLNWSYEGGELVLELFIEWSPWSQDPAGTYLVQEAIARLVAAGWSRS